MAFDRACLCIAVIAALAGCSDMRIVENTPSAVTVRYDGVARSLADATATAQKMCAARGRTANLRRTEKLALLERFAHFDCVSG